MSDSAPKFRPPGFDWLENQRNVWQKKAVLREIYADYYAEIAHHQTRGRTLEIGSGGGTANDALGDVVRTDIVAVPWIDIAADAQRLPFRDSSFANVVAVDVLHHIEWPLYFLREAFRVLEPGGRLILLEPAITLGSWFFYKFFHPEPIDTRADPLGKGPINPSRDPAKANQAVATLLVGKHRSAMERALPGLQLTKTRYLSLLAYPLSGGFRSWSLIPAWAVKPVLSTERVLLPLLSRFLAFRLLMVFERPRHG